MVEQSTVTAGRFQAAIEAFDRQNAADPQRVAAGGGERPRELVQAERLSAWVERLDPDASEPLRLAARCQHLRRWEIPRAGFPAGRVGYLRWRTELGRFHADESAKVLLACGYDDQTVARVRRINLKQGPKSDPDVQTMEDALCLSFVEHELAAFAAKHDDAKIVEILGKTWKKMSPRAREIALGLAPALDERVRRLLSAAVAREQ